MKWPIFALIAVIAAGAGSWTVIRLVSAKPALPAVRYEPQPDGAKLAIVPPAEMARFCEAVGLPEPPELATLDPVLSQLLYEAHARVAEEPDDAAHYAAIGDLYQAHKYPDQAIACYRAAVAVEDQYAWHYQISRVCSNLGRTEDAIDELRRTVEMNAGYVPAYFYLGELLYQEGHLDEAEAAYREYARRRPRDENGYIGLAGVAAMRRDDEEAFRQLREAAKWNPRDYRIHFQLAQLYKRQGNDELAAKHQEMYESLPHFVSLSDPIASRIRWLGSTPRQVEEIVRGLYMQERYEEAIRFSRDALRRRPRNPDVLRVLASAYRWADKPAEALETIERCLEIDPDNVRGLTVLSDIYLQLQRYDDALDAARRAISLEPENEFSHWLAAESLRRSGKPGEAVPYYRRAVELDPDSLVPARMLVEALWQADRLTEARDACRHVLELKPDDQHAAARLEAIERRLGTSAGGTPASVPATAPAVQGAADTRRNRQIP